MPAWQASTRMYNVMKNTFYSIIRLKPWTILPLSLIGGLGCSYFVRVVGLHFPRTKDSDFLTAFPNYHVSKLFGKDMTLFNGSLAQRWMGKEDWNYGPLHQIVTVPLYLFTSVYAVTTFLFFFLLITYFGTIQKLYKLVVWKAIEPRYITLMYCILIFNYPFLSSLNQRNLEILEVFIIMIAMTAFQKEKYFFAGFCVGLASGIKFLPGIIVLHFIISRNWKALKGFILALLPQVIFAQIFFGWQNNFTIRLLIEGDDMTLPLRQGLNDVLIRSLANGAANAFSRSLFLTLFMTTLLVGIRYLTNYVRKAPNLYSQWRVWSLLLASICVLAPHANNYYFVLLTPLIIQLFAILVSEKFGFRHVFFGFGIFLISLPLPMAVFWRVLPNGMGSQWKEILLSVQSYSPIFFGTLILIFLGFNRYKSLLLIV